MNELLLEYRKTMKETRALLNRLQANEAFEEDIANVRSWISSLEFAIKWMRTGQQPKATRGIERRAGYEREIPIDPYFMQLNKDREVVLFEFEETKEEREKKVNKESLVKEIMRILDKKERMVFELAAKEFSQREIAKLLNMPHATVQKILERCKRKIVEEGWILV